MARWSLHWDSDQPRDPNRPAWLVVLRLVVLLAVAVAVAVAAVAAITAR